MTVRADIDAETLARSRLGQGVYPRSDSTAAYDVYEGEFVLVDTKDPRNFDGGDPRGFTSLNGIGADVKRTTTDERVQTALLALRYQPIGWALPRYKYEDSGWGQGFAIGVHGKRTHFAYYNMRVGDKIVLEFPAPSDVAGALDPRTRNRYRVDYEPGTTPDKVRPRPRPYLADDTAAEFMAHFTTYINDRAGWTEAASNSLNTDATDASSIDYYRLSGACESLRKAALTFALLGIYVQKKLEADGGGALESLKRAIGNDASANDLVTALAVGLDLNGAAGLTSDQDDVSVRARAAVSAQEDKWREIRALFERTLFPGTLADSGRVPQQVLFGYDGKGVLGMAGDGSPDESTVHGALLRAQFDALPATIMALDQAIGTRRDRIVGTVLTGANPQSYFTAL